MWGIALLNTIVLCGCILGGLIILINKVIKNYIKSAESDKPVLVINDVRQEGDKFFFYSSYWGYINSISEEEYLRTIKANEISREIYEKDFAVWSNKHKFYKAISAIYKINIPAYYFGIALITICLSVLCVSLLLTIIFTACVPSEIIYYTNKYHMMQDVISNGTDLENATISQTKIEFNDWLAHTLTSLERWGNWSQFFPWKEDILKLNYLI